jgi:hypothetical protein
MGGSMSSVVISGDTSGAITLAVPAVAGTNTITVPASTGTMALLQTPSFATTIGVGNATASASGAGISFPATQSASTDANTLDDYEEGTWTPTQGSFSTWTSPVFTATYTKVGRLVTLFLQQTSGTVGWSAGQYIGGVPFTVAHGAVGYALDDGPSSNNGPVLIWTNNRMYFQASNASETTIIVTASYEVS